MARRAGTRPRRSRSFVRKSLPIWSCSVWGLPCPPHYCVGGALLPHLFTLTWALRPGRYVFCGTFRRIDPRLQRTQGWTTLPDVIRHTALRSSDFPPVLRRATVRSGCQPIHYSARGVCRQRVRQMPQARGRVLSLHLFGCEEERVCQQGQADQQRNQSGEIDRLVVHQPMQKRHDTDADDGGDQSA